MSELDALALLHEAMAMLQECFCGEEFWQCQFCGTPQRLFPNLTGTDHKPDCRYRKLLLEFAELHGMGHGDA